jgi:hypothetical protein
MVIARWGLRKRVAISDLLWQPLGGVSVLVPHGAAVNGPPPLPLPCATTKATTKATTAMTTTARPAPIHRRLGLPGAVPTGCIEPSMIGERLVVRSA